VRPQPWPAARGGATVWDSVPSIVTPGVFASEKSAVHSMLLPLGNQSSLRLGVLTLDILNLEDVANAEKG